MDYWGATQIQWRKCVPLQCSQGPQRITFTEHGTILLCQTSSLRQDNIISIINVSITIHPSLFCHPPNLQKFGHSEGWRIPVENIAPSKYPFSVLFWISFLFSTCTLFFFLIFFVNIPSNIQMNLTPNRWLLSSELVCMVCLEEKWRFVHLREEQRKDNEY